MAIPASKRGISPVHFTGSEFVHERSDFTAMLADANVRRKARRPAKGKTETTGKTKENVLSAARRCCTVALSISGRHAERNHALMQSRHVRRRVHRLGNQFVILGAPPLTLARFMFLGGNARSTTETFSVRQSRHGGSSQILIGSSGPVTRQAHLPPLCGIHSKPSGHSQRFDSTARRSFFAAAIARYRRRCCTRSVESMSRAASAWVKSAKVFAGNPHARRMVLKC
jgi:hypothetical protein